MSQGLYRTEWTPGEPPEIHHMDQPTAYEAGKLGMWLFLATEILLFGVLFAAYALFHTLYPAEFHHASQSLNWKVGAFNTCVLLYSSYTAAMAVHYAKLGDNRRVRNNVLISVFCGLIFMVVKYFEWSAKYSHGLFPGTGGEHGNFNSPEFAQSYKMFFGLYYCLTGLHGLHVIIGSVLLLWVAYYANKNRYSAKYYAPVEIGALYWHLVDLIWIYLFPLLYLIG